MATVGKYSRADITIDNPLFSSVKTMVESVFYGNNVEKVTDLATAYKLACEAPGAVITDMPVKHTEELGLPADAKVLVFNDGKIVGRTAAARRILGQPGVNATELQAILREAVYQSGHKKYYTGDVVVGLDPDFMVKAHLLLPVGYEMNFYSYLLNFQIMTNEFLAKYEESKVYPENDIYLYADPEWSHPDYPNGLALFDPEHNVAAVLGLRYFGELKKATLTLAWATAHRNGFVACHGGMKQYHLADGQYTMAAFGLSGSGKSTITLAKHGDKYDVDVLHDDAFVINQTEGTTTALEPAYFDKTQDYPLDNDAVNYFLTCQNVGVTLDEAGKKVIVTEDIRNGNGRTVKSRYVTPNRVDHLGEKIDAIFWIMKDDSLPPVVKIDDPVLAAVFGLTLATKRSTAENVVGKVDLDQLVIEPFANPFRCYPLGQDYEDFRDLFAKTDTACYILNTGFYGDKKVTPQVTLGSIEKIVENTAEFAPFGSLSNVSYLPVAGYEIDLKNSEYLAKLKARMENRLHFITDQKEANEGYNALPDEAADLMRKLIVELDK